MSKVKEKLGVGIFELAALSLLGLPRVILHDLSVIEEGTFFNSLLVFVPVIVWIIYILRRKVKAPFLSMLLLCIIYGIILGITHQILWTQSFPEGVQLGGNLSELPAAVSNAIIRGFAFLSSITTGTIMGLALGAVTWLLNQLLNRIIRGNENHL